MSNPVLQELRRAFTFLNGELFDSELPTPAFVIGGTKKSVFSFDRLNYQIATEKLFGKAPFEAMLDDLIHQMCHISNHMKGIKDETNGGYHNRKFAKIADNVGLKTTKQKGRGHVVEIGVGKKAIFDELRKALNCDLFVAKEEKTKKKYFLKYVCGCPSPHNSIRSGRRPDGQHKLNVVCQDCGQIFKCVEGISDAQEDTGSYLGELSCTTCPN